jgi:hypothetical protein
MNKRFCNFVHTQSSSVHTPTSDIDSMPDDHLHPPYSPSVTDNYDIPDWKRIPSFDTIRAPVSIFEDFTEGEGKKLSEKSQTFFVNELEEPGLGICRLVADAFDNRDCPKKDLPSYLEVYIHLLISSFMLTLPEVQQATFSSIVSILVTNGIQIGQLGTSPLSLLV